MDIMRSVFVRSTVVAILFQSLIFSPIIHAAGELAFPTGDLVAPEIKHSPITETWKKSAPKEIRATVTDNVGVKEVLLFYRVIGSESFLRMRMTRDMSTDEYFATPPDMTKPGIEYYIQATDLEGNTLLRGHSFSPLTVKVENGEAPVVAEQKSGVVVKGEEESKGISKWVWIGLGAVAIGALAGGGGDDGGGGTGTDTVSVTITAPTP